MSKVYLLLRNNKQSGPHSLEELIQLGLKPLDLIWVEGKSAGWSYPSEINILKPYLESEKDNISPSNEKNHPVHQDKTPAQRNNGAFMPPERFSINESPVPVPSGKVFVSLPARKTTPPEIKKQVVLTNEPAQDANEKLEQKAAELRKKIQSYVPENTSSVKKEVPVITKYSSTLENREEEYTSWIYNKKANKTNEATKKWAAIGVAAILILMAGYGVSQFAFSKDEATVTATVATPMAEDITITPPVNEKETATDIPMPPSENYNTSIPEEPVQKMVKKNVVENDDIPQASKLLTQKPVDKKDPVLPGHKKETGVKKDIALKTDFPVSPVQESTKPEIKTPEKSASETAVIVPKKKKSLNEKVDAFFNKFSRKLSDEPLVKEPKENKSTTPGVPERKAVYRDDTPPAVTEPVTTSSTDNINLADFVEISSNKPSENWMLGVHGLKVSLRNTSKETVKTAVVELRYYTEQNEVLEKKTISFSNILPGKSVTLPVPDHRLADHTDYRLLAVK